MLITSIRVFLLMKNDSLRSKALVAGEEKLNQNGGVGTGSAGCSRVDSRALRLHVTSRILIGYTGGTDRALETLRRP